jgi:predicted dehydrogenase
VSPERVELARRLGAVGGVVLGADDAVAAVSSASAGHGADAVVVAAATSDDGPIHLAAEVARDRAVVSVVGDVGLKVPRTPFFAKELTLRVSRSYGPGRYDPEYEEHGRDYPIGYVRWTQRRLIEYLLQEIAAGRIRLDELVSHEFDITQGEEAYAALSTPHRMAILLRYPAEPRPVVRRALLSAVPRPATTGRLRVGLIGPGLFARATLLPILSKLDVDLVAVAARTGANAFASAREYNAAYAATDPQELIDDDSIDALVIATRHATHPALAARALERGKAVFVEKPLAIDEAGLEQMEGVLAGGGRLVVDFNRDLAPTTEQVRRHLMGRAEPLLVDYRVNAGFLDASHWLRARDDGGGRLVGEGCHFVELCSSLIGAPLESVQVASLGVAPRTLAGDNFSLLLRYADGSVATVQHVATGSRRMPKERVEVLGAGRSAAIEDFRRARLYASAPSLRRARLPAQDKGHAALLERAVTFFREGGAPPIPYERIVETTRATLIAREALASGDVAPVLLPPR